MKLKSVYSWMIVSFIAIFIAIIMAEGVLRIASHPSVQKASKLKLKLFRIVDRNRIISSNVKWDNNRKFWLNEPGVHQITGVPCTINSFGLRNPEFSIPKPGNLTRIICVGGSSVFGAYNRDNETFPSYLRTIMSDLPMVEIINAGVNSYTSDQIVKGLYRIKLTKLHPDKIIYYGGFNERHNHNFGIVDMSKNTLWMKANIILLDKSLLYRAVLNIIQSRASSNYYDHKLFAQFDVEDRCLFENYEKNIRLLHQYLKMAGGQLILVKQMMNEKQYLELLVDMQKRQDFFERCAKGKIVTSYPKIVIYFQLHLMQILERLSKELEIPLIDPAPEFLELYDKECLFKDIVHLTPQGNKLLARIISEQLRHIL